MQLNKSLSLLFLIASALLAPALSAQTLADEAIAPTLYCGTDDTGFAGETGQLAAVRTSGPVVISSIHVFDLGVPLNGLASGNGALWSGQPEDVKDSPGNDLRQISETNPPVVLSTLLPGANSFNPSCCNEQMALTPQGFFHVHYSDSIQRLVRDDSGKSEVKQTYNQSGVVGIAYDGTQIWISKWGDRKVGTWDPTTNTFTAVFSTPADAGGLAWDVANGVLWVGMLGGEVIPYDATGRKLSDGFKPFGDISGTVDGLAFVGSK